MVDEKLDQATLEEMLTALNESLACTPNLVADAGELHGRLMLARDKKGISLITDHDITLMLVALTSLKLCANAALDGWQLAFIRRPKVDDN